jgi:hypothetical protein
MSDEPVAAGGGGTNIDTEFHGDIRLISDDREHRQFVARFTHGTLEWIRPIEEVPRSSR